MAPQGNDKEYRKLTAAQLKALLSFLPEALGMGSACVAKLRALPCAEFDSLFHAAYNWAWVYEGTLLEHLTLLAVALNKADFLTQATQFDDPQQAVLDDLCANDPALASLVAEADFLGLSITLCRSLQSITLHQRSLSALLAEARAGQDASLFHAIRIDRSIMGGATAAARICRAEMRGEKRFFIQLRNALKGPSVKYWPGREALRYTFALLREIGCNNLSDAELERLLVDQLEVYPKSPDARRNLRKQYQQSRKIVHDFN